MSLFDMTPSELADAVRRGIDDLTRAGRDLAAAGWSVPMSLTPAETYDVFRDSGSPEEIGLRFVQLYERDDGQHFSRIADDLLYWDILAPWRTLLEQTFAAYRRRDFVVTVPALLTVCEGLLMIGAGNNVKVRDAVRKRSEAENEKSPKSIRAIVWLNIRLFIEELFRSSEFTGPAPVRLNRHWVLHGRQASEWTQADCLSLLQAVHTISSLSRDHAG